MKTKGTEASNCADSGVGMNEAADSEIERWNWTRNIVLEIEIENWILDNIVLEIEIQKWILNHIVLEIDKWIPDDIVLEIEIENENQTMNEI